MTSTIDALLATYPRTRPPLSDAHKRVYEREYKLNREGTDTVEGLAKKLEAWMHRKVASRTGGPVLELGAGTLNHLRFESDLGAYDVVEPFTALYKDSPRLAQVRTVYGDIAAIPPDNRYARIVSVAVLEHLTNLPADVARSALMLDTDGVFQAGIPSEGGLAWGLAWRMTTGVTYWLRNRIDYKTLVRHEHINSAPEILAVVRHLFDDVRVTRFALPFHHLSVYAYIEARRPRRDRAEAILTS